MDDPGFSERRKHRDEACLEELLHERIVEDRLAHKVSARRRFGHA
jgi:hypothetical protein